MLQAAPWGSGSALEPHKAAAQLSAGRVLGAWHWGHREGTGGTDRGRALGAQRGHWGHRQGTHCEVVPKQLHDEGAVFVGVFVERVQLCDGLVERLQQQTA